jgi:hypothetical protein
LGATVPLFASVEAVATGLLGPLGWWTAPWSVTDPGSARDLVTPGAHWADGTPEVVAVALLAVLAVVLAMPSGQDRAGRLLALAMTGVVTAMLPLAIDAPYVAAVLFQLALAVAGLVGGAYLSRQRFTLGIGTSACGAALLGVAVSWAVAVESISLVAFGIAALAAATAWLCADERTRPAYAVLATAAVLAEGFAVARSADLSVPAAGFVVCVVAGIAVIAAGRLLTGPSRVAVEATGAAGYAIGVGATVALFDWLAESAGGLGGQTSSIDMGWLAHSLVAGGVAAAVVSLLRDRRRIAWLSVVLLTAASWVRLVMADVTAVEAYTVPPALVLLAVGLRRRRQAAAEGTQLSSWRAFGGGLGLALGPSLLAALGDDGLVRPLLLGLAALAVTLYGAWSRQQAPLVIGGAVLAVDAIAQLAPYAAALPRWVSIGAVGFLLLALGTTYERRMRDLRTLADRLTQLT